MGARWTAWHFFFGYLLRKRGPRGIDFRDEVPLSAEPPRVDYLLVRKPGGLGEVGTDDALTLRKLRPMLPRVSVVEYKSPSHPYRHAHLDRLWGYVHIHFADQKSLPQPRSLPVLKGLGGPPGDAAVAQSSEGSPDVRLRDDLCAVLIVASRTPSLEADITSMGLRWEDCGDGYWRVHGGLFALYVVEIDVVGPAEGDELLYSLGHGKVKTPAAGRFWLELTGSKEAPMSVQDMEGYTELLQKVLETLPAEDVLSLYKPEQRLAGLPPEQRLAGLPPEQRLAGLPPEQRLAGLPPEQRLAGLDRDHAALALPIEVLRVLPEEYVQTLTPEVQAEIHRRLGRNGHAGKPPNGH